MEYVDLKDKEIVNTMNTADKFAVVTQVGAVRLLPMSSFPTAKTETPKGLVDRKTTLMHDVYNTAGMVYRALTIYTDITPADYQVVMLDIKDIISWNFDGNISFTVKVGVVRGSILRVNLINNITPGLVLSIYAYFNSSDRLCFTINFNGTVNISSGNLLAFCSVLEVYKGWNAINRITSQGETDKYTSGSYANEKGIVL